MVIFALVIFAIIGFLYALALLSDAEFGNWPGFWKLWQVVLMLPKGSLALPEFGLTITIGFTRFFKALFVVPPILLDLLDQVTSLFVFCSSLCSRCAGVPSATDQADVLEAAKKEIDGLEAALATLKEGTEEFQEMQAKVDEALEEYDAHLEKFKKANEKAQWCLKKADEKLKDYLGEEGYNKLRERVQKRKEKVQASMSSLKQKSLAKIEVGKEKVKYSERKEKVKASMSSLKQKSLAKIEVGKEKVKASMSSCNKTPANDASQISTPATQMTSEAV